MKPVLGRLVFVAGAIVAGALLFFALDVPQDVRSLLDKQSQIRDLQRKNAGLTREIGAKKQRIEKLRDSRTEQELEIRERQRMLRKGETSFILQDQEKK